MTTHAAVHVLGPVQEDPEWWRSAVIYQVYPRSFADSDGDGIGDIPGLLSRLDYLADLGVDAIWITPCYPSPLKDGGYDVADYRAVDPRLGTLADLIALIEQAHARGMRILMDIVPNHSSSEHQWFKELLDAPPGSAAWDRYIVRPGRGSHGEEPPNNWTSVFHGPAWSQVLDGEGRSTGYWYLHLFDATQPDFNWAHSEVRADFIKTLAFWFDLGIDGFRIDVAHGLAKDPSLPDILVEADEEGLLSEHRTPFWDQDEVHEIYREWRALADTYHPPRIFCSEAWVESTERMARYLRPDELHTSFNFEFLKAGWDAVRLRAVIEQTIDTHQAVGAPPTWVLSNHDVIRHRTRLAPGFEVGAPDLERGLARARAATAFTLALPGSTYIYQGEELGLAEVDLADEVRQDPAWFRSGGTDGFRDGCRVPIPWSTAAPGHGFGPSGNSWLPQPAHWADYCVTVQEDDSGSTLNLYRRLLQLRRLEPSMGDGEMSWLAELSQEPQALGIRRSAEDGSAVNVILNLSDEVLVVPGSLGTQVLLATSSQVTLLEETRSDGADRGQASLVLGPETCVWLRDPAS